MCKAPKPMIQPPAEPTKPPAQFTTPDMLAGVNQTSGIQATRSGRDSLRIDLGSAPRNNPLPTENDQVRDYQAEEAAAKAQGAQTAFDQANLKKAREARRQEDLGNKIHGGGIGQYDPVRNFLKKKFR
jgi:hypothetical protein